MGPPPSPPRVDSGRCRCSGKASSTRMRSSPVSTASAARPSGCGGVVHDSRSGDDTCTSTQDAPSSVTVVAPEKCVPMPFTVMRVPPAMEPSPGLGVDANRSGTPPGAPRGGR
jgi:hypothetical protein